MPQAQTTPVDDLKAAITKAIAELTAAYDSLTAGDYDKAAVRVARVANGSQVAINSLNVLRDKKSVGAQNPAGP